MQKTLPKGWKWAKLGDIARIVSGSTPRTDEPRYWDGDILWVTPADLSKLETIEINDASRKITKEGYASCSTTMLPVGTVLLSSRAPIGHLAITDREMCTNQGFKSLVPSRSIHSYYLYFVLKRSKDRLVNLGSGATFTEISKTSVERFEIPLPPLPSQFKIVEILKEADDLRKLRQQADEKMKDLIPSLFIKMFGDPVKNPKGWKVEKLRDVVNDNSDIVGGPFGSNLKVSDYREKGVPIIRLQNIDIGKFIEKDIKYITQDKAKELSYHSYQPRDLILAKLGDPIGKTCLVPETMQSGIVVSDVVRIRVSPKKANVKFILHALNSQYCASQLNKETFGTTRPRVNLAEIRNLNIPLPSLPLQKEFAKIVEDIESEKERQAESRKKLDELFNSLMQGAFTGELVA